MEKYSARWKPNRSIACWYIWIKGIGNWTAQIYHQLKKRFSSMGFLVTFLILTMIVTFPVVLDFGTQAAGQGCYDKCHMMWRMWWAGFAVDNNLDFHHTQYLFQPSWN